MATPFLYFDLGNVLLHFDHDLASRQMAKTAGVEEKDVRAVVFESDLQWAYERGEISSREFYEAFCDQTHSRPDYEALLQAASGIFSLNVGVAPIVAQLRAAHHQLGILSNTCAAHWEYCASEYRLLTSCFGLFALSYQLGSAKPAMEIYRAAIDLAARPPEEIFFVDDRPENVVAAKQAGIDAVLYTTPSQLAADLRQRGVEFNY